MILVQKIIPEAVIPTRGSPHAAGLDLSAAWEGGFPGFVIRSEERCVIPTGLKIGIPPGYYGQIHPRSGLAVKNGINVLAGVIDADYRGEVKVVLHNTGEETFFVEKGMRIAQLLVKPCLMKDVEEVADLPEGTVRGTAGFGSTGV